jgi:chromosome segregation protein
MYLKSLELSGFKSFAKKATLDFTSTITGIVGPNGSGKSNVAEAFRFVLGEQSIKSLRGKRGEDMIWNGGGDSAGSSGRANRGNVKLTFDNSRRIFPSIDFDEVVVERVVHRDNSNEYILNGSQVRLKDIVELLAGAHIGATGHHIISQGEADRILSANIRERREMIEDALGLKIYQWKKLESLRKLEKTDENMKQVESLRREIAPHLRFLKKQVEKVEKAETMRKDLIAVYKEYFAIEENYVNTEKARLTRELSGPKKELSELDRALEKSKNILASSKDRDTKSDAVISLERNIADVRNDKDSVMRELGRIEGEISANKRAVEKEKERQKKEESKTVYLKDVEEVVASVEKVGSSFGSIDEAKRVIGEILGSLRSFITKHRSINDTGLIADAEAEIVRLNKEKAEHDTRLKSLGDQEARFTKEYNELKHNIEKEKDTNREAEKEVFRIIARQNEIRNTIADLANKLNVVLHDEEALKRELGEAAAIAGREAVDYRGGEHKVIVNIADTDRLATLRGEQENRRKQIEKTKVRLEDAGAGGGAEIMKEYRETEERDTFLSRELNDLERAKKELEQLIIDLNTRIDSEFKNGILKINTEFQNFFALMFGGGRAELTVVKEVRRRRKSDLEELSGALSGGDDIVRAEAGDSASDLGDEEEGPEGLDVSVSLPRKKVKGLMMLSGGERALTSIALLFAISQVNPPPFIILDETDAALDEANSRKYGDMIESLSKHSQLILITHNRETMSRAGVLYGVTMGADGASKLLSLAFEEAVRVAK